MTKRAAKQPLGPSYVRRVVLIPDEVFANLPHGRLLAVFRVTGAGQYDRAERHHVRRPDTTVPYYVENILMYCTGGTGTVGFGDRTWPVHAGDMAFVPACTPHEYAASAREPWSLYWAHFRGESCGALFETLGVSARKPLLHVGTNPKIAGWFTEVLDTLDLGFSHSNLLYAASCFQKLLAYVFYLVKHEAPHERNTFDVRDVIGEMLGNLDEQFRVQDLAKRYGLSKFHFSRRFKERTGYAPIDYFIRLKMQKAAELLLGGPHSIRAIARRLGYEDPYYFSRAFKKMTGVSPAHYRAHRSAT
ncbi:MAG: helix-turn-helix domain-containing protein [Kiritimatiellae bacterium]|nr:helix-turn-helix domain-containing protein [Kiritimatiellia bacterium]